MEALADLIAEQAYDLKFGNRVWRNGVSSLDFNYGYGSELHERAVVSPVPLQVSSPLDRKPGKLQVDIEEYIEGLRLRRQEEAGTKKLWRATPRRPGRPQQARCKQGHPLLGANVRVRFVKSRPYPIRECWTCIRAKRKEFQNSEEGKKYHREYMRRRRQIDNS